MNDKVSIIMPCYNSEKFIKDAIESVLKQTYQNWELIIIDDNSTDNSTIIVESYKRKDFRIKLLKNSNNTRMPATPRNIGILSANGRYIAFLDSDDIWYPSKLENQIPLFKDEKCAVVYSYYKKMSENGNVSPAIIKSPKTVTFNQLLNGDCIGNLTGIYDTYKVGKVFQKEIHAEDYLMWLEILNKGYIAKNTNSVEAMYRISLTSTSGNKLKSAQWNWNIYYHELHLPILMAFYHFSFYLLKGIIKYLK